MWYTKPLTCANCLANENHMHCVDDWLVVTSDNGMISCLCFHSYACAYTASNTNIYNNTLKTCVRMQRAVPSNDNYNMEHGQFENGCRRARHKNRITIHTIHAKHIILCSILRCGLKRATTTTKLHERNSCQQQQRTFDASGTRLFGVDSHLSLVGQVVVVVVART